MLVDDELDKHLHVRWEIVMWMGQRFYLEIYGGARMSIEIKCMKKYILRR
jgi:hypothetical protein